VMLTKPLREGILNQSSLRKFFIIRYLWPHVPQGGIRRWMQFEDLLGA
jgi:hypothetical protein